MEGSCRDWSLAYEINSEANEWWFSSSHFHRQLTMSIWEVFTGHCIRSGNHLAQPTYRVCICCYETYSIMFSVVCMSGVLCDHCPWCFWTHHTEDYSPAPTLHGSLLWTCSNLFVMNHTVLVLIFLQMCFAKILNDTSPWMHSEHCSHVSIKTQWWIISSLSIPSTILNRRISHGCYKVEWDFSVKSFAHSNTFQRRPIMI